MAADSQLSEHGAVTSGHHVRRPADFGAPPLLGASPALLHGKIVRGGMGTGMPAWGMILTDDEVWAVVRLLYGFSFDLEEE
jgi:mono/diheme cytochrome c family protein